MKNGLKAIILVGAVALMLTPASLKASVSFSFIFDCIPALFAPCPPPPPCYAVPVPMVPCCPPPQCYSQNNYVHEVHNHYHNSCKCNCQPQQRPPCRTQVRSHPPQCPPQKHNTCGTPHGGHYIRYR